MYHIKNDKRSIRSATLIADALERLLDRKTFMDITVSELQREAGVGRSTFYRLFDTIDDVVIYLVDESFRDILADYNNQTRKVFTKKILAGIIGQSGKLLNIVAEGRTDLIVRPIKQNLQSIYRYDDPTIGREAHYRTAVFAGACISILLSWSENGKVETVDELAEILDGFLSISDDTEMEDDNGFTDMK